MQRSILVARSIFMMTYRILKETASCLILTTHYSIGCGWPVQESTVPPEPFLGLYLSPSRNGHCNWHVCELALPVADYHVGPPCHGRMNSVMP